MSNVRSLSFSLLAMCLFAVGCRIPQRGDVGPTPKPPVFLSGPAALLFTNGNDFVAHVQISGQALLDTAQPRAGELAVRGGALWFHTTIDKNDDPPVALEGMSYIRTPNSGSAYALNEPLQAYAPLSFFTNSAIISMIPVHGSANGGKIDGQTCHTEQASITFANGSAVHYSVWRASDLGNIPMRIQTLDGTNSFTLTLSNVRLESPANSLFTVPDGFVRYDSIDAMTSQALIREIQTEKDSERRRYHRRRIYPE